MKKSNSIFISNFIGAHRYATAVRPRPLRSALVNLKTKFFLSLRFLFTTVGISARFSKFQGVPNIDFIASNFQIHIVNPYYTYVFKFHKKLNFGNFEFDSFEALTSEILFSYIPKIASHVFFRGALRLHL